jgi:molybdenum cofactor synthesis domain-containing protein
MNAALVTVGDELLSGDTANTNATWLGSRLAERGVTVKRMLTVPDETGVIAGAVARYSDAFDAVVVTGGLGGTPDDITIESVAKAFDRDLVENELAYADVERHLESIAGKYSELNVDVSAEAKLPEGARPLLNRAGMSPGCVLENVYVLPGIPSEMKRMFEDVADEFEGDESARYLYTEEPEANLIERLDEVRDRFGVHVGCYPDREAEHNRLKIRGSDGDTLDEAEAWLTERIVLAEE